MASITVTTLDDTVNGQDGRLSLREALTRANGNAAADTIQFARSLEGGTLVLERGQLLATSDVTIDGDRNNDGTRVTIDGNDESRVLEIRGGDSEVRLSDLAIRDGLLDGENGAGVRLGAGAELVVERSSITGNDTGDYVTLGGRYGDGGGIFAARGSRLTIADSTISGNQGQDGGGIFADTGSTVRIDRSTIDGNLGAGYRSGQGGGIFALSSDVTINASTISDNVADGDGAGILARTSQVTLIDSTVSGNEGNYRLGSGNGAGVLAFDGSTVVLDGATVSGNVTPGSGTYDNGGAGIYVAAASTGYAASRLHVDNSIVAGNFSGDPGDPDRFATDIDGRITSSNGDNIFGTEVDGNRPGDLEGIAASRLFRGIDGDTGGGRLALNGGPTETVALRDAANNPALGGGDPDESDRFDQRGFARPRPADTDPDIGAFELNQRSQPASQVTAAEEIAMDGGRSDTDFLF